MTDGTMSRKGQYAILLVAALAMFMDGLDGSIVNVALPVISEDFGGDAGAASWIVTVYLMVLAGLILIFGKISDSGALKRVFTIGFMVFAFSSLACGLSTGLEMLLISRAAQGVGAAMLAAAAPMLCIKHGSPANLGFCLAVIWLGASVGAAMGPAVGGILTQLASWHWIFLINVPIGLVAAVLALRIIPPDKGFVKASFDVAGSALLFAMLASGLYLVESIPSSGVTGITVPAALMFVACLALFVARERRCAAPVLNLGLFKHGNFVAVLTTYMLLNACYMGAVYLVPFYFRIGMGFDTFTTGIYLLIPALIPLLISAQLSRLSDRTGRRTFAIIACAMSALFTAIYSVVTPGMGAVPLIIALAAMGLVWGIGGGSVSSRIVENAPRNDRGSASSLMSFITYFGSALGTALFAGLFGVGSGLRGVDASQMPLADFLDGFHIAMIMGLVLSLIALALAAWVNEKKHGYISGTGAARP